MNICFEKDGGIICSYDIMSAREREQAKPAHRERRMSIMNEVHDIIKLTI